MDIKVHNQEGKEVGKTALPERLFGLAWNPDLVHQVVVSMQANARTRVAHTKDRSDVRGGGRKPWKQKGTGRARHGSRTSPLWRGGGVTFGPRKEKSYTKKINKKMRAKALHTVLSRKLKEGEVLMLDTLTFAEPKTKTAKKVLVSLAAIPTFEAIENKKKNAALIAIPERSTDVMRSFQNIGSVFVEEVRNLNPVSVLTYKYLILVDPAKAIKILEARKVGHAVKKEAAVKKTAARKVTAKKKVMRRVATRKTAAKKAATIKAKTSRT